MSAPILIEVENVSRRYGAVMAVRGLRFMMRRGEVLGLLGPNGAGKTTTMQMLTGNLAPTSGRILINGHDLRDEPLAAKASIGYLPEYPPLYRDLTVDEYLDYCAALHRIPRRARRAAREHAKARCGLTEVGTRVTGHLSKGYQQRTGLAQAIIHDPPIIILDEPTGGLDPIQIREIRLLIRALGRDHGVILSTHILPEAQASCDRVQIINKGEIVLNEKIDDLDRRLCSSVIHVTFRRPPELARISALPGIRAVTADSDTRVRIFHEPTADPSDALMRLATDCAWGLIEMAPERQSLESLFVELTATPPEPA
ncbi:MAG: ATP-binding cassette domain-containing protein [Acidiferrobacter sp.]